MRVRGFNFLSVFLGVFRDLFRDLFRGLVACAALMLAVLPTAPLQADGAILTYHRFGENRHPSTNTRVEQLREHVAAIAEGQHTLIGLDEIARLMADGKPLPDRLLAVSVDDAYRSFKEVGWPIFKEAGIPVTLFVATTAVDGATATGTYLTWDEIRQLRDEGVTIGHHSAGHIHMPKLSLEEAFADVDKASKRFQEELGEVPTIFAYPYGEFSLEIQKALEARGFIAAFGQYSSAVGVTSPRFALPRFPINERYGARARFELVSRTHSLDVRDVLPIDPLLADGETNPPLFGFTLGIVPNKLSQMNCFPSHLGQAADLEVIANRRVEIRFDKPFPKGRSRINCTLPKGQGPAGSLEWYWFGRPFLVPGGWD